MTPFRSAATAEAHPFIPRQDGSREHFGRRRLLEVVAVLLFAVAVVALVGGTMLHRAFIEGQKDRLLQIALGIGNTIEAVARFDDVFSQSAHPKGAAAATLSQAFDGIKSIVAHDPGIEFVIARRSGDDRFNMILSQIHEVSLFDVDGQAMPPTSPFIPILRRAYAEPPGTALVVDPSGGHPERLAGFAHIDVLDLALLVMIDTDRVVAPLGRAMAASALTALFAVLMGALLIRGAVVKILGRLAATVDSLSESQRIARVGNWEWDIARDRLWLSDEGARILGAKPGAIRTMDQLLAAVPTADRARIAGALDGARHHRLSFALVHDIVLADGTTRHVRQQAEVARDAAGEAVRMSGTIQDITEAQGTAKALAENEERFRAIFEQAAIGIGIVTPERRWIRVNSRLCRILGYAPSELLGISARAVTHPDDLAEDDALITRLAETGAVYNREKRYIRKDGATVWANVTIAAVRGEDDAPKYFIATVEDISARKEAEQQILKLNENLEQRVQERTRELRDARDRADDANVAKSRFLSSMSHEIRTPLNAILGFTQLLEHDPRHPLHPDQKSCVQEVLKGGNHLLALINDILDLSRIESGKMTLSIEAVQAPEAVASCLAMVRPLADKRGIVLADQVDGRELPAVAADYTRLRQVLTNLLSNAIKYNRDKGLVTVSCQIRPDRKLRLAVTDTGRGISAEKLKDMFTPFNRLGAENSSIEGTGIGLNITKRLVELMGGEIGVESVENRGSTFWFDLPLDAAAVVSESMAHEDQRARVAAPSGRTERRGRLILYVEDNPSNQMLMERVVAAIPRAKLMMASSAELGIEMARGEKPDLILMDINLPGMDGFAALKELRADDRTCAIPVLALSANAMPGDAERGLAAGFLRYIVKPFVVKDMIEALTVHLPAAPATDAGTESVVFLADRTQRQSSAS